MGTESVTKKKSVFRTAMDQISGIFFPILNLLTAASIMKSIVVLLVTLGVMTTDNGIYILIYAVSDGFFYFLPCFLALTAAKQWKVDPYLALMVSFAMLYPDITAILENGKTINLVGMTIPSTIYHSSVIPILMSVGLLHFVQKPCEKYIPESIRGFMKPIVCLIIVLPVTFLLFGPMGSWIGNILTKIFFAIYDWNSVAAGAFMGFVMQPMVVIGAHWSVVPVSISNVANNGYDVIMPLVGGAVYGQAGAALAVGLMYKNKKKKQMAYQASLTAALGVTEPALFSVNVPLVRPMLAACLAGAVGGAMAGFAGSRCTAFAFPSFLTSVAYVGPGFAMFLLSMGISFVLGFLFTFIQKNAITKNLDNEIDEK